jgi:hypothetical protein
MKTFLLRALSLLVLISVLRSTSRAADTNPPPRLTVELRDGSRVVGESLEKNFKFHSALLGEIKLDVNAIRSVECVSSNTMKLSTTNGDTLTVSFVDSEFAVKTSFGKVELPVKSVRMLSVSLGAVGTTLRLPGLVALWSGEGSGNDSVNGHNAIVSRGLTYTQAKIGLGFDFTSLADTVSVPAFPALDVGAGQGFTLTCWIAPASAEVKEPLMEWRGNGRGINQGVHLWISDDFGGIGGPGCVYANIVDAEGGVHFFASAPRIVQPGVFQQVALTYDKASGQGKIYYNGSLVTSEDLGSFTPKTDTSLLLGQRADVGDIHYLGILDEVSVFNRALSADEIRADYEAGSSN